MCLSNNDIHVIEVHNNFFTASILKVKEPLVAVGATVLCFSLSFRVVYS